MTLWHPARWPLRTRVALAFLATAGVALTGLGVFVHARLGAALEDRLRDTVLVQADQLEAVPGPGLVAAVRTLGGEVQAQVLTAEGDVRASSRLVAGPLVGSADGVLGDAETGWRDSTVLVFDDDDVAEGERGDPEGERFVLLVRRTDDGVLAVGTSREDVDEALAELRNQLLVAGPLALAVAGGLGYLVAGAGLRPIDRMRTHATTISARSAGERLPVPAADDELRRLALTLNAMLERLDDGLRRERRFVAEASHDLRTPLTLMITEIELALSQPRPPEALTAALRSVHDEVRRMIALAEDLLLRAGEAGASVPIEARPVDLTALAQRVADRFRPAAADRVVRVTARRSVEVPGDPLRLDRALSNLVDNAIRHGAGEVTIEVGATRGGAVVVVSDHGDGFSPDDATGLGLGIVREIVRAHGGEVEVRRVDDRTLVRVELPAVRSR